MSKDAPRVSISGRAALVARTFLEYAGSSRPPAEPYHTSFWMTRQER